MWLEMIRGLEICEREKVGGLNRNPGVAVRLRRVSEDDERD